MEKPRRKSNKLYCLVLCSFVLAIVITSCGIEILTFENQSQSEQTPDITPSQTIVGPITENILPVGAYLKFDSISLEQGLSQSQVYTILQDSQGFIWFGTEAGLNKFDGYSFTYYQHTPDNPNSLSSNWISAMLEDDSGIFWIGTNDGGINRYDRKLDQFTHFKHDPEDNFSLSSNAVTTMIQDRNGNIWIGTNDGGVDRFDQENERFIHYQHDSDDPNSISANSVSIIYEDQEGDLWIGTDHNGLNRLILSKAEYLENENQQWMRYQNNPSDSNSLGNDNISAIYQDQSGSLWIGTNGGGLDKFDQENNRFIHFQQDPENQKTLSDNNVTTIYQDQSGILWIGTFFGGLNRFNPNLKSFDHYRNIPGDPHSLSSNSVMSIFQDREGVLWVGTHSGGVNKLDIGRWKFAHYKSIPDNSNSLSDNMVWTLNQDQDGDIWIGTMVGGLNKFIRKTGDWVHYTNDPDDPSSLIDDWVASIYLDRKAILWVGTRSGLDRFDLKTETFTHYQVDPDAPPLSHSNDITAIHQGQDDDLWIGTSDGFYRFDYMEKIWSHHFRPNPNDPENQSNVVLSIVEDKSGILWVGTIGGGLIRFDPKTETFTHYTNDPDDINSLSNDIVLSIIQSHDGTLWIGTPGGLNKFDPGTEVFTRYLEKDGMANDNVYCMVEDRNGYIWLSTNKGLSKLDPKKEVFKHYDVTDGLQSNEFNITSCFISESEEMYFGGINGFNTFFPDQIIENPITPPVALISLTNNGEEIDLNNSMDSKGQVTLKWPNNNFEFEFAALSFAQPEKNQYAYMLEGFDKNWNETGTRRHGQYTNLPGGTYNLKMKGSNNDGVWNELGTSLLIKVIPPFWTTWWFQGISIISFIGLGFYGYRLRVRNIEKKNRELKQLVEKRTSELKNEIDQRTRIEEALRIGELEKAVLDERSRLARELHDSVTQSLYSLTLFSEAARHKAEKFGDVEIEQTVNQIGKIGLHALKEMRLLVFELQPPELEKEGLLSAIRRRLEAVEERAGVDAQLLVDDHFNISGKMEQEFFRIVQEALNNSLKHAAASEVIVYLRQKEKCIEMEIKDNGVGFDSKNISKSSGMGLKNIHDRVEKLGGNVTIQSTPGNGTSIRISVGCDRDVKYLKGFPGEKYE